jgi:hypothetical protein
MDDIWRPGTENFSMTDNIEFSARNMILSTTVTLCLLTGKFEASAREISILQPEVKSFPRRMVFSDWKLRISLTHRELNLTAGR